MGIVQMFRNLNLDNKNVIKSVVDRIIMILWNVSYLINKGNLKFNLQNLSLLSVLFLLFFSLDWYFYWHFCCCFDICCILYTMLSEGAGQA